MNFGRVRYSQFVLILFNREEYRRGIGVGLIIVGPVEDSGGFCEEVALNRVALSTFTIGDSVEDEVSLFRMIMDLERHIPW